MRILFVHQNFPAQFVHLAPALVRRGHDVRALTAETNTRPSPVPRIAYKFEAANPPVKGLIGGFAANAERGAAVARAAEHLRKTLDYTPEVVFGHVGWGESLFLKEVWPEARLLMYAELYWRSKGLYYDFDPAIYPRRFESGLSAAATTASLAAVLSNADKILSPTVWQAQSFPDAFRSRISVIHDGIDTAAIRPADDATVGLSERGLTFHTGDEVLTFVNRTLEPHRGFHIFMRALPDVLKARPQAHVIVVGGTDGGYGSPPSGGRSWRDVMLSEVGEKLDLSRVHFVGKVPHPVFVSLMQVSRVHAYLTYPGVLSWSMLEAMSAGALVVASATPPVAEVIEDGVNGRLVDFFDAGAWSRALIEALAHPDRYRHLRDAARSTIVERYDLADVCLPRLVEFVETPGTASSA